MIISLLIMFAIFSIKLATGIQAILRIIDNTLLKFRTISGY